MIAFLIVAVAALALGACSGSDNTGKSQGHIEIGALLPLSGALASYGETSQAALNEAVSDLGGKTKITLVVEDTTTDPQTALAKLRDLKQQGIKIVIGPFSSAEVREVKDYADQNGILLVSPLSTSQTLAIPDDNVFRFTPDDQQEGVAMAALIWDDGVRMIVPVSRNDEGNLGLQSATGDAFAKLGGTVAPLVTYEASATDFGDTLQSVSANISAHASGQPAGIYLTAFGEVTNLFSEATKTHAPTIGSTPWFGSDSVALSKDLVGDQTAATFAEQAHYPNPILGLSDADNNLWQPVADRISQKLGREPDAFALAAYDALTVAFDAFARAGPNADVATLKKDFVSLANDHHGLTGDTRLNPAGDRALGNYDFWSVCSDGQNFTWTRTATFTASADGNGTITHLTGC